MGHSRWAPAGGTGSQPVIKAQGRGLGLTRLNRCGVCLRNSVPRLPLRLPCSTWGPAHRTGGTRSMGGPGPQEETHSLGALLFFCPCPSTNHPFFAPDPIPPTRNPAPARDRPLNFSILLILCRLHRLPVSSQPQPPHPHHLIPHAGPVTQRGPCVGFCLCSLQPTRGGHPNQCLGTKGEGTCPVSAQQRSSVLTFSPRARPGQQPGHWGTFPEPSLYKLWSRVSRGRGVC